MTRPTDPGDAGMLPGGVPTRLETWSTTFEGLLFDIDGTLVDSLATVERQWWTFFDWYDLPPEQFPEPLHGRRAEDHIRTLLPRSQVAEAADRLAALEATDMTGIKAVPGAAELLASLGDIPWGAVTSGRLAVASARLAAAGLPTPPVLITAEDVQAGKPDPEPFLAGRARLGRATAGRDRLGPTTAGRDRLGPVTAGRAGLGRAKDGRDRPGRAGTVIAFEDAPAGISSARAAGCQVVALTTTYDAAELTGADIVIPDLTALTVTLPIGDDAPVLTVRY
jgi:sugar-phosphatase